MDPLSLKKINVAYRNRQSVILVTEISSGRDRVIAQGDTLVGAMDEAVGKVFRSGNSALVEINGAEFFLNVYQPRIRVVIIGAVQIAQSLALFAREANFEVEVIDPRESFAAFHGFEDVKIFSQLPKTAFSERPLDKYCALVAVTHDPLIDDDALVSAVEAGCFYIGALGGSKTNAKRVKRLIDAGLSIDEVSKINAPIGLDIGASNPPEIAISIIAQIVESFRKSNV